MVETVESILSKIPNEKMRAEARQLLDEIFCDSLPWLTAPNTGFGGRSPKNLIDEGHPEHLIDRLRAIADGCFS